MTLSEIKAFIVEKILTGVPNNIKSFDVRSILNNLANRIQVQEVGRLQITKVSGNNSTVLEIGDKVTGIVENNHIVNAIYLGGDTSLLASFALVNDPTYSSDNPTQNTYADIPAMLADQANQTSGFDQRVTDASADPNAAAGSAVYRYLGTTDSDLEDYIRLSDSENQVNLLDEDDLASNSDTKGATQQSIKTYVDDSVANAGGGDMLAANNLNEVDPAASRANLNIYSISEVDALITALSDILDSDDPNLDILQEIVDFIKINKSDLDQIELLLQSDDVAYDTLQEIVDAIKAIKSGTSPDANVSGTHTLDFSKVYLGLLTMTADTTFSIINASAGDTPFFHLTGDFSPTFTGANGDDSNPAYDGTTKARFVFDVDNSVSIGYSLENNVG